MPLYEIGESGLARHEQASLADLGLRERQDLQRLIRDEVRVLDDDLLIVAEEFGQWEDARRRIDLLAVDKTGCLVVIEKDYPREYGRKFHPEWWYIEQPFLHEGRTWLVSKGWGTNTEPALTALCERFPDVGVSFRRADSQ